MSASPSQSAPSGTHGTGASGAAQPAAPLLRAFIDGAVFQPAAGAAAPGCVPVISPVTLQPVGLLEETPEAVIAHAVERAHTAYAVNRRATLAQRAGWLNAAAAALERAVPELIGMLIADIGKPRKAASFEAQRSAAFLRTTAAQALVMGGETVPVDSAPAGAGHIGFTRRVPYGVVAGITPFNAPINLLIQKVAPALVAGNAIVVKPHPTGARIALRVAALFAESGLPAGLFNVVTGDRDAARHLVAHPAVMAVTFTGGTLAGDALVRAAGAKKFVAELGSNAANIVLADADIADAARRIASAAFEASGQQCISAQRIIVEASVYEAFLEQFVAAASALKVGDPDDPATDIGPMISVAAASRVMGMMRDVLDRGGRYALEPRCQDAYVSPGIAVDVPRTAQLWCDEAFGPVALVERAANAEEALQLANDSPFGLQGSVFTASLRQAMRFSEEFDVGALWVNEASRFRLDMYPFGGMKRSGFGREGVRHAIEELSQLKFTGMRFD
jgi:acyl-CoA reductase-like NAD-dependent aldehyde dehydrogenase